MFCSVLQCFAVTGREILNSNPAEKFDDNPFILGLPAVMNNGVFIGSLGEKGSQSCVGIFDPRSFKAQSCVCL